MLEKIRSTLQLADGLIQTVRRISTELRPGVLDLGLVAALEWQAQEFQTRTGIRCKLRLAAHEELAPNVSTALFRMFRGFDNVAPCRGHYRRGGLRATGRLALLIREAGVSIRRTLPSPNPWACWACGNAPPCSAAA
jgi:signal transduction histidine kinase